MFNFFKKKSESLSAENVALNNIDIIAPSEVEIDFNSLRINNRYYKTYFISNYPRFVNPNWLEPVISFDHSLLISMFIYPTESKGVLDELKRKVAEMEATIQTDFERGKAIDPTVEVALDDARALQEQLVKGVERFFQFAIYITVPAQSKDELFNTSKLVESTLASLSITAQPTTLQMNEGLISTLPLGQDLVNLTHNMDTTSLATTFPFASSELTANEGIMYGINEHNGSLILFDRFTLENANAVVFAKSGAGKSTYSKEMVLFDDGETIKLKEIGVIIENLINKHGAQRIDHEMEGVINPGWKVWTFDKNLKGSWSNVTAAARKKFSPRNRLYKITTKSGRSITITADHNLVILREGKIRVMRSETIKIGEAVPLPRLIDQAKDLPSSLSISPSDFISFWPGSLPKQISLGEHFLTLLGLVTSEGHITPKTLQIYNTDRQILGLIDSYTKTLGLEVSPLYKQNTVSRKKSVKGFNIRPAFFARFLCKMGAGGLSGEKRVPPILFSLSNQQITHYLRAYYEGDGGVENHEVNVTTKSPQLASDLLYLLLRFGIIARIHPKIKSATNTVEKIKNSYYQITISGKDNLLKFAEQIGFLTEGKNFKLHALLQKSTISNTNIDTVPTLQPIFNYLYKALFSSSEIPSPVNLSPLKKGIFEPSREELQKFIVSCEQRLKELYSLDNQLQTLRKLPTLSTVAKIQHVEKKLAQLKLLANSNLFWDPIAKIERIKHKEKYVYDLQVDNGVFLAGYGGMFVHNSYFVKLEAMRSLMFGTEVIVIDPEQEYLPIAKAIGGEFIDFSPSSSIKINPFDMSGQVNLNDNELGLKILSLTSFLKLITGTLEPQQAAVLDRALKQTYQLKGITDDPKTQGKTPPLMEDLYKVLIGMEEKNALDLAARLERFVKGSLSGIFSSHSNITLSNAFTVFSVKNLPDQLRPLAIHMIVDFVWTKVRSKLKKRIMIVDEAWYMMKNPDSADFLVDLAKRSRKYYLGLTTITQDVEDFLATERGKEIISNSSIQVLLKQAPSSMQLLSQIFNLSEGEQTLLLSEGIGEGLFFAGNTHVAMAVVASEKEHKLITSNPADIVKRIDN